MSPEGYGMRRDSHRITVIIIFCLFIAGILIYFSGCSNPTGPDGTIEPTVALAKNINSSGSSNPAFLTVYNNTLYFAADGGDGKGNELWKFDGTNATRISDIYADASDWMMNRCITTLLHWKPFRRMASGGLR